MAAPKKRLGKGKNRLKFEDVSPSAEAADQEHVGKKGYGGKVKKMAYGGSCRGMGKATRGGNYSKMG
jgi:hypothetical protein